MLQEVNKYIIDIGKSTCGRCYFLAMRMYDKIYPYKHTMRRKTRYVKFPAKISVLRASRFANGRDGGISLYCNLFKCDLNSHDQYSYRCQKCKDLEKE